MPTVFEKLNLKDQREIVVLDAPEAFEPHLAALAGVAVRRELPSGQALHFVLVFATQQATLDRLSTAVAAQAEGDAIVWVAYPKGTSKRHRCEFNRDTGWGVLRAAGFDTVRQIAIDEDWTALRFRRLAFIKPGVRTKNAEADGRLPGKG